ncbi:23S rRNA (guanosine(2251)-2'-O)-methyltransferase RlmB [Modestobacter sp. I12A-02628]|uniref:23S rRNA (Guanosine(2251)-2'-O)-methyltransferase RlmB n=1 Tax=Goekera deserti TaxID=2497753 RepID=A0A7K3WJ42_9ACTN|nr:23S rRNA (guanosine(2251)-2'-O)-methyltransferase RlmB [Goekera deserti]MPQ98194.1 23S rRNA (guanosine(2251)-2'-O)-methyltransferase RlmB [Goekera deserti]NDI48844.1 23S rRNA (guanosine(2251)-2'-O)-methyltransferase RlmB [Goekera deserti]NEL56525.1 23S rRNA (guanosine(2251)-2'-O)-methyltransferase RlmB [Goekera deserti]
MAGNSQRRGRSEGAGKKKATAGTGGKNRRSLAGRGATPPAAARPNHPAHARAQAAAARRETYQRARARSQEQPELLLGRNPVLEALRASIPATALYVVTGDTTRGSTDERIAEAVQIAGDRGLPLMEVGKGEFDRMSNGALHQGIGLMVPPYDYAHPDDLLGIARDAQRPPLIVALDGITDPRNLGAVIRSAAAFDAHGVVVPQRRSVGMTGSAWRTSAGAAARLRVARAVNLSRALASYQDAGLQTVGLAADGDIDIHDYDGFADPVALVVGAEGAGLSRLVRDRCDVVVSIPIGRATESLNVSVAASIALFAAATARRAAVR